MLLGKVSAIEAVVPPPPAEPSQPPPETPEVADPEDQAMIANFPQYVVIAKPATQEKVKEGEEEPKTWVRVSITLDPPNAGDLVLQCPEIQASGLVVDGRARVMVSSN
jgi:hypothetical protein